MRVASLARPTEWSLRIKPVYIKDNTSYTRRKVPLTEAGVERREPAQWDELRVWDPGDG